MAEQTEKGTVLQKSKADIQDAEEPPNEQSDERNTIAEDRSIPVSGKTNILHALEAAKKHDFALVKHILLACSDLEIDTTDKMGKGILHYLCNARRLEEIKCCLERKPNVNKADKIGWTPLHYACMKGCQETVQLLVMYGANCNMPDLQKGRTPLHYAVSRDYRELVNILVHSGADPLVKDQEGKTASDLCKSEFMKGTLEEAISHFINDIGDDKSETMDVSLEQPTAFPALGVVITPPAIDKQDADKKTGFSLQIRRSKFECDQSLFAFQDTDDVCSEVYTYKLGREPCDTEVDLSLPVMTAPSAKEELIVKTDTMSDLNVTEIKEENEKLMCTVRIDLNAISSCIVVCRPKLEKFTVSKSNNTKIKSEVDTRVELHIEKGTFGKDTTITMEITEPPASSTLAAVLKNCKDIKSVSSFYLLETDEKRFLKPISVKIPLPVSYSKGKMLVFSMDDPLEKESPESWKLINDGPNVNNGIAQFDVTSFSVKATIEMPSFFSESSIESITSLTSQVSKVFRKSRRKEHNILFFCMMRRVGTSNNFKVIVQCCKEDQKAAKVAFWEKEGFEMQTDSKSEHIGARAKQKFIIKSSTFDLHGGSDDNTIEFHPKVDNYCNMVVQLPENQKTLKGVLEVSRLNHAENKDSTDNNEEITEKVSSLEIVLLRFHTDMMIGMDKKAFLSYQRILFIQEHLGKKWWKIFLLMDIPFRAIEKTLMDSSMSLEEKINGLMFDWREKHRSNKSRGVPMLLSALCRSGKRGLVNELQIELREWKLSNENEADSFYNWLVTAYQFGLLIPDRYDKPMSDSFLAMLADQIDPNVEIAEALGVPKSNALEILKSETVYVESGLRSMKILDIFRIGNPNKETALWELVHALDHLKLLDQKQYVVMATKAWLRRAPEDDPLVSDVEGFLTRVANNG